MSTRNVLYSLACAAGLLACEAETPEVREPGAPAAPATEPDQTGTTNEDTSTKIIPGFGVAERVQALSLPSAKSAAEADAEDNDDPEAAEEDQGECTAWETVLERYTPKTGEFTYRYRCAEGGDIAEIVTEGRDEDGSGTYTTTYLMRDGSTSAWNYTYRTAADGSAQDLEGESEGETLTGHYEFDEDGGTTSHEVWHLNEGLYTVDGHTDAQDRFAGTTSFDDPATEANPDWTIVSSFGEDGSTTQEVAGITEGWPFSYTLVVDAEGRSVYDFVSDDPSTLAEPDYAGHYEWAANGEGGGHYTQLLDDGSHVEVTDVTDGEGQTTESWVFDDLGTERSPDQEGTVTYDAHGRGHGEIRTHLEDGSVETCDLAILDDGTTEVTNCR